MSHKFKVGDLITGNGVKDIHGIRKYTITNENSVCKVLSTYPETADEDMEVEVIKAENRHRAGNKCDVHSKYFKLTKETNISQNKTKKKNRSYDIIVGKKIIKRKIKEGLRRW